MMAMVMAMAIMLQMVLSMMVGFDGDGRCDGIDDFDVAWH